jgi:drug/metabolite transporter (DMT)-like permease
VKRISIGRADKFSGFALILLSAASFGAMPVFARFAYAAGADPLTVLFLRFSLAALVMLIIMRVRKISRPRGRLLVALIVMGAVGYAGESFTYFTALTLIPAGLVCLLLYLYPAIVTLLAAIFLKERLTIAKAGALALALTGMACTIRLTGNGHPLGILLGLAAALIYAIYILASSRVVQQAGPIAASTVVMTSTAFVYAGAVAVHGPAFPVTLAGWAAIVAIALISTVMAFVSFFAALQHISPTTASTLSIFEPVVTVSLAAFLLNETLTLLQLFGGLLILLAVILLAESEVRAAASGGKRDEQKPGGRWHMHLHIPHRHPHRV